MKSKKTAHPRVHQIGRSPSRVSRAAQVFIAAVFVYFADRSAIAQDYIVQANGAGGAYTTVQSAINAAVSASPSGKVIEIRSNTAGGTQKLAQRMDLSGVNISSTNEADWLTIRVREGDTIILSTTGNLLSASGTSRGWKIEGNSSGYESLQFGDRSEFNSTGHLTYRDNSYTHNHGAEIASTCSNYAIRRALFTGSSGSGSYEANHFDGTDYELDTVAVVDHGTNYYHNPSGSLDPNDWEDWGDAAIISGQRVRLKRLYSEHCGHNGWVLKCRDVVVRDSEFSGYWGDMSPKPGARATAVESVSGSAPYGPILMEGSIIRDAGESSDQPYQSAMKTEANRLIIRDSFYFDTDSYLWHAAFTNATAANTSYFSGQALYHNTSYISKGTWWNAFNNYNTASGNAQFENNLIANNLFQQVTDSDKQPSPANILWYNTANVSLNGHSNGFHGTVISGNIVGGPSSAKNVHVKGASGATATFPIDSPTSGYTANVTDNIITDVTFANVGSPQARTTAGFAVTNWGSASAGDAPALTTVSANSSGTTITVGNARPFFDGWGIRGEVGDYLYIGSTATAAESAGPVQIASINYTNNTITLTASRSVTAGQGVWFGGNPANGSAAIRKNRGAYFDSAPAAPSSLTATAASSSQINLSWTDNASNETGFEVDRALNSGFSSGLVTNAYTTGANPGMPVAAGSLSGNTTYYFRVRATNASGDSTNSNTASATTLSSLVLEAEDLTVASNSDSLQVVTDSGASAGEFHLMNANADGDQITYTVNVPTAGTYQVVTGLAKQGNRGIFQLKINGTNRGAAQDYYVAGSTPQYEERNLGTVTLSAGNHSFRFECTGKNASASNRKHALDYIKLTPQ